ncbi:hypothetical protein BSL78_15336 [Apostichopus japonicus]|uniref:NLR family CARD domain-containing protein 4 n=1 Tax=Stichopus japonicus TaxID=307972 RepID=A0A2G8KIG9_STIJA|nr:hypothetical protein BSL78_15336 [Apostichopus japonicus]
MKQQHCLSHSIVLLLLVSVVTSLDECESPQYLELGKSGVVRCNFDGGYHSVYWYKNTNIIGQKPFIEDTPSGTAGPGYESGEFDINEDGSLIINEVFLGHEATFTVTTFHSAEDIPPTISVDVKTFVKPVPAVPLVSYCYSEDSVCFIRWDQNSDLTCTIQEVRPTADLSWQLRTADGDKSLSFETVVTNETLTQTISVSIIDPDVYSSQLSQLVCKAHLHLDILQRYETVVFVYNTGIETPINHDELTQPFSEGYTLGDSGVHHEGVYTCTYSNGTNGGVTHYDLNVYVYPVPAYLEIEGCNHEQYCSVTVMETGSLTCKVSGIRPEVNLEWRGINDESSEKIEFYNHQSSTKSKGDTTDIILTVDYMITQTAEEQRLTLECRATGQYADQFKLTTHVDLLVGKRSQPTEEPLTDATNPVPAIIAVVLVVGLLVIGLVTFLTCRVYCSRSKDNDDEEKMPMMKTKDLKTKLKEQLKETYNVMYSSLKPIPYLKDKMYSVNELYVEGGIECLLSERSTDKVDKWVDIESYQNLFSDPRIQSKRRIIEAEPGYGKSTLTLQLAYEWCTAVPNSLMGKVDLLLIFKLRQMKGITSIYEATKLLLLPRESNIGVDEIKDILAELSSVVIILDGFDEYPDYNLETQTDILDILKRHMFQHFDVILTTRSSFLPKSYAPQTKHIRLTGFDKEAQDKYLRRAVTATQGKVSEEVKEWLEDNPVLADLCQAPLFFALYAHASQDRENLKNCNSATVFFRYIVSCIKSHTTAKSDDNYVSKIDLVNDNILSEVAYLDLTRRRVLSDWKRDELSKKLGKDTLEQYVQVGILREEETIQVSDVPGTLASEHIKLTYEIRFYHKLFSEWYAANYVADRLATASVTPEEVSEILEDLEPSTCQYVYRFACGLNPGAAKAIINYLKGVEGGDEFAILCILEHGGAVDYIIDNVTDICSREIQIGSQNTRLLQRSVVQLLEIATAKQIPVFRLLLSDSLKSVNVRNGEIVLKSDLRLPILNTLKALWLDITGCRLQPEDFTDVFQYSLKCESLKTITFSNCLAPVTYGDSTVMADLKQRNIKVQWYPSVIGYRLDLSNGFWKDKNGTSQLTQSEYLKEVSTFNDTYNSRQRDFVVEVNRKLENVWLDLRLFLKTTKKRNERGRKKQFLRNYF